MDSSKCQTLTASPAEPGGLPGGLGLVIAWIATVLARRVPSQNYTYGLRRATILAALVNAMLLLVAVGAITIEGIRRLSEPGEIASVTVMVVAAAGIGAMLDTCV